MFENVLVGVDLREGGRDAVALARELGSEHATITLAHVYGGSSVARGLKQAAQERGTDLLVVGSCHHGPLGRVLAGNDTLSTLHRAPCAIAIAPNGYAERPHPLMVLGVGSDGSPEGVHALAVARAIAARRGSTIKALSVIPLQSVPYGEQVHDNWPDIAKQLTDEELRRLRGLGDVEGDVTYGDAGEELANLANELDLLIVGSRSAPPFVRWLTGSASDYLARHARCPLLVLPRSAEIRGGHDAEGRAVAWASAAEQGAEKPVGVLQRLA